LSERLEFWVRAIWRSIADNADARGVSARLLRLILLRVGRGADRCQPDGDSREKASA
jgi:hypothetical protein